MPETANAVTKKPNKQEKLGHVVSAKMEKTIVVEVTRKVPHPLYKRIVTKRKKFYAHDEQSLAKLGDVVRIIECRPMSRLKRWSLGEVVRKAVVVNADMAPGVAGADTRVVQTNKQAKKKKKK